MASTTTFSPNFENLLPPGQLETVIREWLHDDMPVLDIGAYVVGAEPRTATLWMKSPGLLAGVPFVNQVFALLNCTVQWNYNEGTYLPDASSQRKIPLAIVHGPVHRILQGERTALNILSRCSGVATEAYHVQSNVTNPNCRVAATRKTTPGYFRIVEKYALIVAGVDTHRWDLSHMVMLKDNHIQAVGGSITRAVHTAARAAGFSTKIEVECQTLAQAMEAAQAGAHVIMLDNYQHPHELHKDAQQIVQQYPHVLIEASGGITKETVQQYANSPYVHIVSMGALTHGYSCVDVSLKVNAKE